MTNRMKWIGVIGMVCWFVCGLSLGFHFGRHHGLTEQAKIDAAHPVVKEVPSEPIACPSPEVRVTTAGAVSSVWMCSTFVPAPAPPAKPAKASKRQPCDIGIDTELLKKLRDEDFSNPCGLAPNLELHILLSEPEPIPKKEPQGFTDVGANSKINADPIWFNAHPAHTPSGYGYIYPAHWECPAGYEQHFGNTTLPELTGGTGEGSGSENKNEMPQCLSPARKP